MGEPALKLDQAIVRPSCSRCGCVMRLILVAPADRPDHDRRTFQCQACLKLETVEVKFR